MSLYEGAVKKPIMTSLCFLAVVIFGLFSLSKLPIDLYPDIDTNTIMVMTAYPGASASDIENNVTRPLENVLNSVSDLKHITSRSSENMSLITLEFEFGNDIDVLTNDVRDKLDMVSSELPDDVENPIIFKFSTDMIPIALLSVQANESQSALYKILDDRVVNPLARIPGVGTVSISGAARLLCGKNYLLHHLSDYAVGKDDSRIAVLEGKLEAQTYEVCHFLYGSGGEGDKAIVAMAAAFHGLEIDGLAWLDGSQSGTAAHYIYNQTRQFGSCNIGDTFLLEADTGAG